MILYTPSFRRPLPRPIDAPTAWNGIEEILPALVSDFDLTPASALEFGVWHGFSTAALANYFATVVGVDTFEGDVHAGFSEPDQIFNGTNAALSGFDNVTLVRENYQQFIAHNTERFNLIHIDIVHTFEETYRCGKWAVEHGDCVIFHDTESFPDVKRAVHQLAEESKRTFFNYPHSHGLGILREGR